MKKSIKDFIAFESPEPRTVVILVTLLWLFVTFWDFGLPGMYMDEANSYAFIPGVLSEQAAKLHHYRLPDNWFDLRDGVYEYPILGGSFYNSEIRTYLGLPFFMVTGFSTEALRLFAGLSGLAAALSATTLIGRVFGWLAAMLFGVILLTDPSNLFTLRSQGGLFWFVILFAALAGHFLLSAWRRPTGSTTWHAIGAGASIAMGVLSYFVGAFFALPLIACGIRVFWGRPKQLAIFLASGIVAYTPVIYAVFSIYLLSPRLLDNYGFPSFSLENRIPTWSMANLDRFLALLRGGFGDFQFAQGIVGHWENNFVLLRIVLIVGACALALAAAIRNGRNDPPRPAFYAIAFCATGLYLVAAFALKSLSFHHLIPLSATVFALVATLVSNRGLIRRIGIVVCALLIATNLLALTRSHAELRKTGGLGLHNETVSLVAPMLTTEFKQYHPVFVSWGFHLQFLFQTQGKVPYTFVGRPNAAGMKKAADKRGPIVVVVSAADRDAMPEAWPPDQEFRFSQRDGTYLYSILLFKALPDIPSGK